MPNVSLPCRASGLVLACVVAAHPGKADATLDEAIGKVAPELRKWAVVCVVSEDDGALAFDWHEYQDSANTTDFWPASCIKIYAAVAALELLHELGAPLDCVIHFEHWEQDGRWRLDCARTLRELLSEVFRRSSNEDYTLLLRLVGIDRINTQFLVPERGFPSSALMRGYVSERPWRYDRDERQRLTIRWAGGQERVLEHGWSGRFYAEERGCTVIDARTGNVTSPRELAECLRRILFHEHLSEAGRYRLTPEQLAALRGGVADWVGLETREPASGPSAWTHAIEAVFPKARFFHKGGLISNYALEVALVDDRADSGKRFLLVPVVNAGYASKPLGGEALVGTMSRAIAEWVQARP
jgi:hypothetical protein